MRWRAPVAADDRDALWMDRALRLAERGIGLTSPNPVVGAVLVKDERVVGEGAHLRAGGPHAEAVALDAAGEAARGRDLLRDARAVRPLRAHAAVRGRARAGRASRAWWRPWAIRTRRSTGAAWPGSEAAGVAVTVGVREAEARALNRAFLCAVTEGRPHVTLKAAMTLDGKIAAADGTSRWITGEAARLEGHRLRFAADAVLVGIGTVLADDPQLTVRHPGAAREGAVPGRRRQPAPHPRRRARPPRGRSRACARRLRRAGAGRPGGGAAGAGASGSSSCRRTRAAWISARSSRRCERWT